MPKFYGEIGYGSSVEEPEGSGVWVNVVEGQVYYGDIVRNVHKLEEGENLNDDISVSNQLSIVADQNLIQNFGLIKYVKWAGVYWSVNSVEVRTPRLLLTLGDIYNGPIAA